MSEESFVRSKGGVTRKLEFEYDERRIRLYATYSGHGTGQGRIWQVYFDGRSGRDWKIKTWDSEAHGDWPPGSLCLAEGGLMPEEAVGQDAFGLTFATLAGWPGERPTGPDVRLLP